MNDVATTNNQPPIVRFKQDLKRLHDAGEIALPSTVEFSAFRNAAIVAVTDNPSILSCKRESIFKAIRTLAGAGLVPDGREAAIVPFKGEAQAMPMVFGLVKVARNSGQVASLWAEVVYEGEELRISVENGERKWEHVNADGSQIDAMARGGEIRGAYAVAKLTSGTVEFQPMSREEIEKRRRASANQKDTQPTGIWAKWFEEMAKKTVIRNLCKRLPMSTEDVDRIMREQDATPIRDVTPAPDDGHQTLSQRLQQGTESEDEPITGEVMPDEDPAPDAPDPFSKEYDAGMKAFGSDEPCPYDKGSDQHRDWMAGYEFKKGETDADA